MSFNLTIIGPILTVLFALLIDILLDTYRRKQLSGIKPLIACFIDSILVYPQYLGIFYWKKKDILVKDIVEKVKKSSGLSDFEGDENDIIKRYQPLISNGLKKSNATLSPFGVYICHNSIGKRILHRLQLIDYVKRHPLILKNEIKRPVFVIGFPRTGTTFLHELLGLHPNVRMHFSWEQMSPIPQTDDESIEGRTKERKIRYEKHKSEFNTILKIAGDEIQSIHRVGYDDSEECSTPCGMEVPFNINTIPFLPFVAKEVGDLGAGNAFRLYRKYLQLLAWQDVNRHTEFTWMLKCPFHLPYLTELHQEFPDATIVWTHRDPVECIASACSLYECIMKIVADSWTIDRQAIGQAVLDYTADALERAAASIEKASKTMKIIHVRYADNIKNPKSICQKVVESAELEFSSEYQQNIDSYLAKNAAERKKLKESKKAESLHSYKLEDYCLTEEKVLEKFADYINKYNLREKK